MEMVGALASLNDSYPAIPDSVPRARGALAGFAASAGVPGELLEGVRLVVSEAVTNVVQHAYQGSPGEVHVSAAVSRTELRILIADDGCGLSVGRSRRGLGLGLAWMAQFSDGLTLDTRPGGGLEVALRFNLTTDEEPDTEPELSSRSTFAIGSRGVELSQRRPAQPLSRAL
jgi:anti-sigma regulatory factor (Ser/Thr protein kinase)